MNYSVDPKSIPWRKSLPVRQLITKYETALVRSRNSKNTKFKEKRAQTAVLGALS